MSYNKMFIFVFFRSLKVFFRMENTGLQSTFELIDKIEFEEKVTIEDLALPSDSTGISNMETVEIK